MPPFTPDKPVSNPPPTTYYVNGILTEPLGDEHAAGEAQKLANKTGTNVGTDIPSAILSEIPGVELLNGGSSLQVPRGEKVHSFSTTGKDPSTIFSVNGKHGFNTYLSNIQSSVP